MKKRSLSFILTIILRKAVAQREGTPQHEQKQEVERESLRNKMSTSISSIDHMYILSEPKIDEFVIAIAVNPCGSNSSMIGDTEPLGFDCCNERSPALEYEWLKPEALAATPLRYPDYRTGKSDFRVEAPPDEILNNVEVVDYHGNTVKHEFMIRPDDSIVIDETCIGERVPHFRCIGPRTRSIRMKMTIPCSDNNKTVSATSYCFTSDGILNENCMQVGYSQNAFIFTCGGDFENDPNCGTFLEIHKPNGSFYDEENTVIAETRLIHPFTNGMKTTTIPLTYKNDQSKLLCSASESKIRVGSMVLITNSSVPCCCPREFSYQTKRGSFMCPRKQRTKHGPFADSVDTMSERLERSKSFHSYPICPDLPEEKDSLYCSVNILDESPQLSNNPLFANGRFFSIPCKALEWNETKNKYISSVLDGEYDERCHYGEAFKACAALSQGIRCKGNDSLFTFSGEVGKVTRIINHNSGRNQYSVTFNDGRSSYIFEEGNIEVITPNSNYEIWWVQRTRYKRVIQHKKSFRVTWPSCTFDLVNDDYFPYAQLDGDGNILDAFNRFSNS